MFCTKCATQISDDANYCSNCGDHIQGDVLQTKKWEYMMFFRNIAEKAGVVKDPNAWSGNLWDERFKDSSGETGFDCLQEHGQKGWELVSVVPIATLWSHQAQGQTREILFVLKRPLK